MVIDAAALFEGAPFPQWVVESGTVIAANAAAREAFGWTDLSQAKAPTAANDDDARWLLDPGEGGQPIILLGREGPMRATLAAARAGAGLHYIASTMDPYRVLDASFFADESAVAQLLDALPIGVYVMTAAGVGFYANRCAFDLLGRGLVPSRDELEVYQAFTRDSDDPYPVADMPIVRALGGVTSQVDDMELARPSGRTPIEVWATPVYGASGSIEFAIAAFSDITARRAVEEERARLQDQLVVASRAAGMADVATSVLHDVGNVLNSVKVSTEQLEHMVQSSSGQHLPKVVDLIEANLDDLGRFFAQDPRGQRLPGFLGKLAQALTSEQHNLSEELAALTSRVNHMQTVVAAQQSTATRQDLRQRLDVIELLQGVVSIHQHRLDQIGATVVWDAPSPVLVETDRHRLMQALINLVGNACDAIGEVAERRLELVCHTEDDRAIIQVRDNGPGVPDADRDRVFQSGFTTKSDGHGFGLHSAANVVSGLGGALRLLDTEQGAAFEVSLPIE